MSNEKCLYDECCTDADFNSVSDIQSLSVFVNLSLTDLLVIGLFFVCSRMFHDPEF